MCGHGFIDSKIQKKKRAEFFERRGDKLGLD